MNNEKFYFPAFSFNVYKSEYFFTGRLNLPKRDSSSIEIFLIDAYVKQEPPYIFILSYYTSDLCKSNVIIDGKYNYVVSDTLSDSHSSKIDLTELSL